MQRAQEVLSLNRPEAGSSVPHFRGVMDRSLFDENMLFSPEAREIRQRISTNDPVTMIPLYCDQGGAVACVRAFAGINRNTEQPENAFFLLDLLLSRNIQTHSALYTEMWSYGAWPTHDEVFFSVTETAQTAFQEARSQISGARFHTTLDSMMGSVLVQYEMLGENADQDTLAGIVAETCTKMKRELSES